jgi:DNA-binding MarR family transcriptional regulator
MFMLGDLEIRVLKALSEKPVSSIWLYETLTKNGVKKLAFENAIKSLEKKKLVCSESLSLRLTENGRKMLAILEAH